MIEELYKICILPTILLLYHSVLHYHNHYYNHPFYTQFPTITSILLQTPHINHHQYEQPVEPAIPRPTTRPNASTTTAGPDANATTAGPNATSPDNASTRTAIRPDTATARSIAVDAAHSGSYTSTDAHDCSVSTTRSDAASIAVADANVASSDGSTTGTRPTDDDGLAGLAGAVWSNTSTHSRNDASAAPYMSTTAVPGSAPADPGGWPVNVCKCRPGRWTKTTILPTLRPAPIDPSPNRRRHSQ